jgi:hypothetical protein
VTFCLKRVVDKTAGFCLNETLTRIFHN